MRVLLAHPGPAFSVADVYNGLHKGLLANGCQVGTYNLDERLEFYTRAHVRQDDGTYTKAFDDQAAVELAAIGLENICYEWWPDVVVIVSGFFIPPRLWDVFRHRPHHVVYYCTESPYEDDRQANGARYADTVILNDPTNLDWFRGEVNKRTFYMPHSYDPDVHHPGSGAPTCDFAFVGTGFPSRIAWLERVDWSGIDVKLGGHWKGLTDDSPLARFVVHDRAECMDNTDAADLYRSARASANLYRKETSEGGTADGWAMGPREVELAACGTFFFREPRGEGDTLFPLLPHLPSVDEFGDHLRWWLSHDRQRQRAIDGARMAILDRTFKNSAARLLELIESAGRIIAA